jgi:tetratricopeptide (TPR) repeat protein
VRPHGPVLALLVAAVAAVYLQVRHHDFVDYDDLVYLAYTRGGLSWEAALRAFTTPYFSNWIPLTTLSLLADRSIHGREAAGFLLTNAALHAASAALLYAAFVRMTGSAWRSAFVAAVFALHPLHVESVAWASQRKDVLSGLFFALTLTTWVGYARRPSPLRMLGVSAVFALGLLAKPILVTLPFVLLLLDYWPLARLREDGTIGRPEGRALARALLEKAPLFALSAAASAIAYLVQSHSPAMQHGVELSLAARIANALDASVAYLRDAFWPSGLSPFYPHPLEALPTLRVAASAALLAVISGACLLWSRRLPYLIVGWLWFLGMLVPVIGFVQIGMQARADRYTYLPLIGLALAVAWGAGDLAARRPRLRPLLLGGGALAVVGLGVAAWQQVGVWRDSLSLFSRAVAVTRGNAFAEHGLGRALRVAGRYEEARSHLAEAVQLAPGWTVPQLELAQVLALQGELEAALPHYRRALELDPDLLRARISFGRTLLEADRLLEARHHLEHALDQAGPESGLPDRFQLALHVSLARLYARQGLHAEARQQLEEALRVDPRAGAARLLLADQYRRRGNLAGVVEIFEEWTRLEQDSPTAHAELGLALLEAKRIDDADRELLRARELGADGAGVHEGLALVAASRGLRSEAVEAFRRAVERDPQRLRAANNLAWLLATARDPRERDAREAVRVAEMAAHWSGHADPGILDTLAAAYAAQGRYDEAVLQASRAVDIAQTRGNPSLARAIQPRLALYRQGIAYLE